MNSSIGILVLYNNYTYKYYYGDKELLSYLRSHMQDNNIATIIILIKRQIMNIMRHLKLRQLNRRQL